MLSESDFQKQVIRLFRDAGWQVWHNPDSRKTQGGVPDLLCLKPGRLLFLELKTEKGRVRPAQKEVLELIQSAGVEAYLIRPSDWENMIEDLLA